VNMTNWDTFLYTREFNAINEDRSMRQATRLLTYPVTIGSFLHELSPYSIRSGGRLTNEGLKSLSGLFRLLRRSTMQAANIAFFKHSATLSILHVRVAVWTSRASAQALLLPVSSSSALVQSPLFLEKCGSSSRTCFHASNSISSLSAQNLWRIETQNSPFQSAPLGTHLEPSWRIGSVTK
jgi:hypothetical protein